MGTITNGEGRFELKVNSEYRNDTLVVSHIGYKNYYNPIQQVSSSLNVKLAEAIVNLSNVSVEAKALTANEIFERVIQKIKEDQGYPTAPFRMDGFYREIHESAGERIGVLECAIEIYDDRLTKQFNEIVISHFRKIYDRQKNTDQFIEVKEGHNHLILLLNQNINLIPLADSYKKSIWKVPLTLEEVSYYNDRLVYILSNITQNRELRLIVDLEDYSVYKNELKMYAAEEDHDRYAWSKVNTEGGKCGAILDHQSFEYRKVNGVLFPYYFSRRFDFRCYDLVNYDISTQAAFSTELLINHVLIENEGKVSPDKMKKKQGLINRIEPYDSSFWNNFNDIKDVLIDQKLVNEQFSDQPKGLSEAFDHTYSVHSDNPDRPLRIGNHETYQFTRADTLFGADTPLYSCYDVHHYDLAVEIDPDKETIDGISSIGFKVLNATDKLRIDLFEYMSIRDIRFKDESVSFVRDYDAVYVSLPEVLKEGNLHTIYVGFEGRPLGINFDNWAGGFLWQTDATGKPFAQSLCQGYGPKGWWPVKNDLSDEPDSVSLHLTVPKDLVAVANGRLQYIDSTSVDQRTYHYEVSNPINNYNIAVHVGDYRSGSISYVDADNQPLDIKYFYLPKDSSLAKAKLSMVPKMLEVYEKYFGKYPFSEDGFKIVQSPYPMEHQSCIAVGQYFDTELILHETAHEWWGNSVSCTDNADIWIHEAFATYAESLYIEETLGYELGQEYLNARKGDILNDHPIVGIPGVNHFHYRIEDKYSKGALMLNTLRHLISNDELWFSSLLEIQMEYRHTSINTDKILRHFQERLEEDYSVFFDQYLRTTKIPILSVRSGSPQSTSYKFENINEGLEMLFELENGKFISPSSAWQTTNVDLTNHEIINALESKYLIKVKVLQ